MAKINRAVPVLLVLLFGLGIFCGVKISRWFNLGVGARIYDTPVLLKQVQTLSQLVTVQYVIEKAMIWEDPPKTLLSQFFSGDNRIMLLANGVVKAGVDFSLLKTDDLQVQGKKIIIKLPAARITDAYLDDKQTKVIERTTGFLRSFDKDLEQNVRQMAVEDIRSAAAHGGILKDASERAHSQLAALFLQLGFQEVEFRNLNGQPPDILSLPSGAVSEKPGR